MPHVAAAAQRVSAEEGPFGLIVLHRASTPHGAALLRSSVQRLRAGECIGYAIRLNGAAAARARALATFRLERRRVERLMRDEGLTVIARLGVDPDLDTPLCIYQLDTAAAAYADRCLRPRGRLAVLRRLIARFAGCDPALGAVVILGRRP